MTIVCNFIVKNRIFKNYNKKISDDIVYETLVNHSEIMAE